ncbi:flagellar biosynthetic protein FliO [Herbinix luporum]|uniref:Flagellar biosynthetic protein FliO n=1 Tax=Herbinix luporum TaxID=1679721 RepID=A0A0K8J4X7_9FIRM|nr:flagellar biosynthetic protein FliO [Herbinix luporum]CUH92404.1 hypothetical protein SD1D_0856 [Herbinix luporum]
MLIKKMVVVLQSTSDEEIINMINNTTSKAMPEKHSTLDNFLQLLGLCLLLVIILLAAYFTSRLVGKYKLGQLKNSNFEIIEVYRISTNKMLQLVKIGSKYVVLGISKDQITYITELEEDDVLFQEIREIDKQSFSQILQKFKGNKE